MQHEVVGDRKLVVVVDDDALYLDAVRRLLRKHADWLELALLPTAAHAYAFIRRRCADLIVIDAFLLGHSGVDACRDFRAHGITSPLALVSGHMTSELEGYAFAAGATFAIAKPFDLLALLDTTHDIGVNDQRRLVEAHVDVAQNIARGLYRRYAWMLDSEDIDGCAMLGLCEAATRFDRTRGEPFIAFAEQRIRGAVFDELRRFGQYGRTVNQRLRRISAARAAIVQDGGDPTDDRIATHLGLSLATVRICAEVGMRVAADEITQLPSPVPSPETRVECSRFLIELAHARTTLPELEETIIRLRYDTGVSLAQVARTLALTLGRVRHLHAAALAQLRQHMWTAVSNGTATSPRDAIPFSALGELEAACGW